MKINTGARKRWGKNSTLAIIISRITGKQSRSIFDKHPRKFSEADFTSELRVVYKKCYVVKANAKLHPIFDLRGKDLVRRGWLVQLDGDRRHSLVVILRAASVESVLRRVQRP